MVCLHLKGYIELDVIIGCLSFVMEIILVPKRKTVKFANRVDQEEVAPYELPHMDLYCFSSSILIFDMTQRRQNIFSMPVRKVQGAFVVILGPVVQSIVRLTNSLRGQLVKVFFLVKCFFNFIIKTLIIFVEKMREASRIFATKNISMYMY